MTVNVFIVDDSATARTALKLILEDSSDINVIGAASNPVLAIKRMNMNRWPDVIISDLIMPEMDGLSFLDYIQTNRPTPFVIVSNHTESSTNSSVEALLRGAADIIPKPDFSCDTGINNARNQILHAIRAAAKTQDCHTLTRNFRARKAKRVEHEKPEAIAIDPHPASVIAIGSSTGGTTLVEKILSAMPVDAPPIVVVQHMPEYFTAAFAKRINQFCKITVTEAAQGDKLLPGKAFIAPGGKHMRLKKTPHDTLIDIYPDKSINRHCPSIDVLLSSVASCYSKRAIGIILTGMGKDGAKGLLDMHDVGAFTIAQSQNNCAVYGMPKAAVALNAVTEEMPIDRMIAFLVAANRVQPITEISDCH